MRFDKLKAHYKPKPVCLHCRLVVHSLIARKALFGAKEASWHQVSAVLLLCVHEIYVKP